MKKTDKQKGQRVAEVNREGPEPLQKESTLSQAGEKMRSLKTDKFPVAAGKRLVGTISGKSTDRKVAGFGHDPQAVTVGENMSRTLFYCKEGQTISEVRKIMRDNGLGYLPVVDGELRIVGVITLAALEKEAGRTGRRRS